MKLKHIFALYTAMFLSIGCNQQPIGNTLLSSGNIGTSIVDTTTPEDAGTLDIQPDNAELSVNIDNSDRVEITGTCKDLDRKNNRILVEVFAGEDETVEPYISNALSDLCRLPNDAGLAATKCFWVTKGIGLIDDAGNLFPQCHNGRFGFAVKLGKILVPTSKYTVRFKLRTLEGILSDSTFSRVTVSRSLNTPTIDSVTPDQANFSCDLKMSPARFNQNILYTLNRTYTDAVSTDVPQTLFLLKNTSSISDVDSVYSWKDDNLITTHTPASVAGIIAGVTYTYTLTSVDNVSGTTKTSTSTTCTMARPTIAGLNPTAGTCWLHMTGNINPYLTTTQWGYSDTDPNWTGVNGDAAAPFDATPSCSYLPSGCTIGGLVAGTKYYFAVREKDLVSGQVGKWSSTVVSCTPL